MVKKTVNSILVTGFTTIILAIFLSPFLYMVFTSLKTQAQQSVPNSPIWPAAYPTFVAPANLKGTYTLQVNKAGTLLDQAVDESQFAGKTLDLYTVPNGPNGSDRQLALLMGFQKGSIFIDPVNPTAPPIVWNGGFFKTLPRAWTFSPAWGNYLEMWKDINYPVVLWNTFQYAVWTTLGVLVSCILVAYGFLCFCFPGRDILFMILISVLFLPIFVTVIPTFTFWTQLTNFLATHGIVNFGVGTWWPLIIPSFFGNPYDVFLLRQYFMTLPRELDEAAMIDGAGPLNILWSVIIPQSYPVIVAVTVFHIVYAWNDYFGPLIYLSSNRTFYPVSVALATFNGMFGTRPELIQAGALVTLAFPLLLFFLAQRFFVQGIVITGVEK
jgi:multiple sugar transport system permease protein